MTRAGRPTPTNHVAWSPIPNPQAMFLLTIVCPAQHKMDKDYYLSFLGDRIQAIIDACFDRRAAVQNLQEQLFESGLLLEMGYCPADEAGHRLVTDNPGVWEHLSYMGTFQRLARLNRAPVVDDLAARRCLRAEKQCPEDGLMMWAGQLSNVLSTLDPDPGDEDLEADAGSSQQPSPEGVTSTCQVHLVPEQLTLKARIAPLLEQGFRLTRVSLPPPDPEDDLS